ncbi:MAG TPA: ergothioneine biosynthesis protein EgtB [Terriglobales bacterium]|nr:ergothioneine biosynthesis protein EgtB [Terriglobales bacterium]
MSTLVTTRSAPAEAVGKRYANVRQMTVGLCSDLSPEDQMVQSMTDASPTKWHLAHTTWFFETFLLKPYLSGYREFHDNFTYLFNSYYKQVGSHPNRSFRGLFSRPSLEEVHAYRDYVDRHLADLIDTADDNIAKLIVLGLNHEQQHQELIVTDIKHALWSNPLRPAWKHEPPAREAKVTSLSWRDFDEGIYSIGCDLSGEVNDFSFDNETPRHQVFLNRFSLASRLVTNGEYLEFMRDGGYSRPEFWLSDGWDKINAERWTSPLYWEECDGEWQVFTVNGMQRVVMSEPVCHISYYEADAFARWSGARLALESEWEVAASQVSVSGNFLESGHLHPQSLSTSPDHQFTRSSDSQISSYPASQIFGDVWEWTSSPYNAYPGFSPAAGALGEYNGKFMCNQFVLRGGSCATPQSHIRATYRNFFPPHARWQCMGIRLAK